MAPKLNNNNSIQVVTQEQDINSPPQQPGQYDTWHGPHPQDQQIVQSSQQGLPRPSPPQQQKQHQLYGSWYNQQQNFPPVQI